MATAGEAELKEVRIHRELNWFRVFISGAELGYIN